LESKDFENWGNRKYLTGIEPKDKRIQAQIQLGNIFTFGRIATVKVTVLDSIPIETILRFVL
jgi:hypothetical protein